MRQVGLDDLAVAAGTTTDTVEELVEDGVVAPGADGTFTGSDVRRVRLVLALRTSGVPFAAVGEAIRKGRLSLDFVDDLAPDPIPLVPETNNELVERLGLDPEVALQLGRILGTCALPDDEQVRADQAEIFELYRAAQETVPLTRAYCASFARRSKACGTSSTLNAISPTRY
jgi:hypothetical protein